MPDVTEEAKRELERQTEKPMQKASKLTWAFAKNVASYIVDKFHYFFTSPFKVIQNDGRTQEIVKLDVEGGLTLEEVKHFLMKSNTDNVKILVKEYTPDDRVFEKTLHAQDKLYEKDKKYASWKKTHDKIKNVPIISKFVEKRLHDIKVSIEKENSEAEAKYMIFTNKSNREWLNETMLEVRNKILDPNNTKDNLNINNDLENDLTKDFTNDIYIKEEDIIPNKEFGIGVEKYTSNFCEAKLTKKDFTSLDAVLTVNAIKYGAKLFEGDNLVTVRFKKEDFDNFYTSCPNIDFYSIKEVGNDGGMKIATAEENNPIIDIKFDSKQDFWEHRSKVLDGKDYIATYQTDNTVDVKITGEIMVQENEKVKKNKMELEELAYEEFIKGGHDKTEFELESNKDNVETLDVDIDKEEEA